MTLRNVSLNSALDITTGINFEDTSDCICFYNKNNQQFFRLSLKEKIKVYNVYNTFKISDITDKFIEDFLYCCAYHIQQQSQHGNKIHFNCHNIEVLTLTRQEESKKGCFYTLNFNWKEVMCEDFLTLAVINKIEGATISGKKV